MSEFLNKSLYHCFHFVILKPQNMISYEIAMSRKNDP